MLNMNFFNIYLEQKRAERRKLIRNISLFFVLALAIGGAFGFLVYSINNYEQRIAAANAVLNTEENLTYRRELSRSDSAIRILQTYRASLAQTDLALAGAIKLNKAALDQVMAVLPEGVNLVSINFSGFNLRLSGTISGAYLAPSLLANLRSTGLFSDIAPISLITEQGVLNFTATCIMKGGALQ